MPVILTLGEVVFSNFEIPERINFGGAQAISVKQLIGGQRVVDSMGRIDDDITWSGLFFGSTATFRAQFLDGLRVNGNQQNLSYNQFNYNVVIKEFKANFERFYQIPYTITVTVVQDLNKPFPVLFPVAYNDIIFNQVAEANDLAVATANGPIIASMAIFSETINAIPSLSSATATTLGTLLTPLSNVQLLTANAINNLQSNLFPPIGESLENVSPEPNNDLAIDYFTLSDLFQLQYKLEQIGKNIEFIISSDTNNSITVNNISLFYLAAKYYGDATQWTVIAEANNLFDPQIQGDHPTTIVIPPDQSRKSGGIIIQ